MSQKLWRLWKDHWPIIALLATALVIAATGVLRIWRSWERPFWDWLELPIIPVVLGLGGIWFNSQTRKSEQELAQRERENDRAIAQDQVREEALQRYLDRMQELILDKGLRMAEELAEIRDRARVRKLERVKSVARARTIAVLRSLDGERRGQVARFLHEANLIKAASIVGVVRPESVDTQAIKAIIDLQGVDLSGANLEHTDLLGDCLSFANLTGARLSNTRLSGANLFDADLYLADLSYADLSNANLSSAFLEAADLRYANLINARNFTNQQLTRAETLVGATMPDGTVMTEEAWEEFKKRYRQ